MKGFSTVRGGDGDDDVKGFQNDMDNNSSSPIALIAYTPSHTITDMTNNRRYKSPGPREIYANAMKENAVLK